MNATREPVRAILRRYISNLLLLCAVPLCTLPLATCAPKRLQRPPNVVIVLLDTLRSDHLGCYGYGRETSPHIDRLAREGIRFATAVSTASWTQPAVASLLSGLYPSGHGLTQLPGLGDSLHYVLPEKATTLAEALEGAGYQTGWITTNILVNPDFHLDQGFQATLTGPLPARSLSDAAVEFMKRMTGPESPPFLLYLHYNDVHGPYRPPAPFDGRFASATRTPLTPAELDSLGYLKESWPGPPVSAPDYLEYYVDRYDDCIAYADDGVGRLLAGIDSLGVRDNTLVLVLADHGEEFLDHGGFSHGRTLYHEVLRIPMIARWPGRLPAGRTISAPMSLVDVMATLLDFCGIGVPAETSSVSRAALWRGGPAPADTCFAELELHGPYRLVERTSRAKWIYNSSLGALTEYYDLARDPGEQTNRIAEAPRAEGLEAAGRVATFREERRRKNAMLGSNRIDSSLDEETLDRIKSLNYIH